MRRRTFYIMLLVTMGLLHTGLSTAEVPTARELIRGNLNYMRGKTSVSIVEMTVHRPDWQRVSKIKVWTRGEKDSLFTLMAPPKDKGNGTLKLDKNMWTFNPKVNRVIQLPPSMMARAWMGSDFSNNDLAKSDSVIDDYEHTLTGIETLEGKDVYVIKSIPRPEAAVIWGMLTFKIREDLIPIEEIFYDEDFAPVKILEFSQVEMLGDRLLPRVMKMYKAESPAEYTLVEYKSLSFDVVLKDRRFTLAALKNPGR